MKKTRTRSKKKGKPSVAKKKKPSAKKSKKTKVPRPAKKTVRVSKKHSVSAVKRQKPLGVVIHFYREIKVAVVKFSAPVTAGVKVRFRGATTDFTQKIDSMQYDHRPITKAPKGKQVGVRVKSRVRMGDKVHKEK